MGLFRRRSHKQGRRGHGFPQAVDSDDEGLVKLFVERCSCRVDVRSSSEAQSQPLHVPDFLVAAATVAGEELHGADCWSVAIIVTLATKLW